MHIRELNEALIQLKEQPNNLKLRNKVKEKAKKVLSFFGFETPMVEMVLSSDARDFAMQENWFNLLSSGQANIIELSDYRAENGKKLPQQA